MTKLLTVFVALAAAALAVLALQPRFDLDVAALFYRPPAHFVGDTRLGIIARYTAWAAPFAIFLGMAIAALLAKLGAVPPRAAPRWPQLLFAGLSLALGPGLLVHGTLKEISHRPRPYNILDFGGKDRFRPFTRFDGACAHNCSFPSGETATAVWTLAPASLLPPPWRGPALAAALLFAAGTGLLRIAFGGHFLSDVVGAALITALVMLGLRRLLRRSLAEG